MNAPLFSIIIPVYNVELYLMECLDSVLKQDFSSVELICINDGSTDSSAVILNEYKQQYPERIKVFTQANAGLSAARNKAVEVSEGDYLFFLDSDDYIPIGALSRLAEIVHADGSDIVAFNSVLLFNNDGSFVSNTAFNHPETRIFAAGMSYFEYFIKSRGWGPSAVCFYIYKRELLVDNKLIFEPGLLHEDELFMPQVLSAAGSVTVTNDELYIYRMHGASITKQLGEKNYKDKLIIAQKLYEIFKTRKIQNKYTDRCIYNLSLSAVQGIVLSGIKSLDKLVAKKEKALIRNTATSGKERFVTTLIRINLYCYYWYLKMKR